MSLKRCLGVGVFLFLVVSAAAQAQRNDAAFWNAPDKEEKDANGRVTYSEKRDKTNNTIRVFQRGQWYVHRYDPRSQRIVSTDTGDSSEDYRFDDGGYLVGITVHAGALSFSLSRTRDGRIQSAGLPTVYVQKDRHGRDQAIVTEKGSEVAGVRYDPKGYIQRISLNDDEYRLDLRKQGNGTTFTEVLSGRSGKKIVEAVASGDKPIRDFAVCLDPLVKTLGLTETWANDIVMSTNTLKTLTTLRSRGGEVVAYILEVDDTRVGFDRAGKALFYDVRLNFVDGTPHGPDSDAIPSVAIEMSAVAPSRVLYTRDGTVAAYGEEVAAGAIASFWTETAGNGTRQVRFRKLEAKQAPKPISATSNASIVATAARQGSRIRADTFYMCDISSVCTGGDGIATTCTTTYYYCSDDSGSGGYSSTTTTRTGGGGTTGGNKVVGDAKLQLAVNTAWTTAEKKLQDNPPCIDILNLTDANGSTLAANLLSRGGGMTFVQWMETKLRWVNGYGTTTCDSGTAAAWTVINGASVNVCPIFSNLSPGSAANRAMHEVLHTLGLPEKPPDPNAMTSTEINNYVGSKCGGF